MTNFDSIADAYRVMFDLIAREMSFVVEFGKCPRCDKRPSYHDAGGWTYDKTESSLGELFVTKGYCGMSAHMGGEICGLPKGWWDMHICSLGHDVMGLARGMRYWLPEKAGGPYG